MDNYVDFGLNKSKHLRKRRSYLNRRPPNKSVSPQEYSDYVSLSSTPSDHVSDTPSDGNIISETIESQKKSDSTGCISRASYTSLADAETVHQRYYEQRAFDGSIDFKSSVKDNHAEDKMSEIVVSGQPRTASDGIGSRNKFSTVKLKVGGVTYSIHKGSSSDGSSVVGTSTTKSTTPDATNPSRMLSHQADGRGGLCGVPWKDFSKTGISFKKTDSLGMGVAEKSVKQQAIKHGRSSKSKSKKYLSDEEDDEDDLTTRRRAILTTKDTSPGLGANLIQFPDGLPPAPQKKPKEQLSEAEQQLKRAEAAQRRKIQNEKAARESEAEAIRKILGQDSSRRRRQEKIKQRQDELAKERTANAATIASNFVRWVMGPSGTVVIFPNEIGLPSIFESKPCRYPPPREKCAGPSCANVYKYRDSKSNLPLCSLGCYGAIHDKANIFNNEIFIS